MEKSDKKEKDTEIIEDLLKPRVHPDIITKEGKVQFDGKQYSIRIPLAIIDELNIKKGEPFIIEYNTKTKEYSIRFKNKDGKETTTPN